MAVPGYVNFPEVNLRFYVRRGDWRGVVFIREFVPHRLIAWAARQFYGEPYQAVPMRAAVTGREVRYEWHAAGRWNVAAGTLSGAWRELAAGSIEEFITEHYWGHTARGDATWEYGVEHPRWRVQAVTASRLEGDWAAVYGKPFGAVLAATPASAFVADGSPVTVRVGCRL